MSKVKKILLSLSHVYRKVACKISGLESVALLGARFYIGWAFFSSGLTKLNDWDSTLFLFEEE